MEKDDILRLETRRRLYNFILKYPGCHLRKICEELKTPKTTIDYHLRYFEKHKMIYVKLEDKYHRYYIAQKVGNVDKEILSLLRQNTPRKIVLYLFLYPEHSREEISKELGKPITTIFYHLDKLIDKDVLEKKRYGHKKLYKIKDQKRIYHLLIKYEKSLLLDDFIVKHLLRWVKYVIPDGFPKRTGLSESSDVDDIFEYLCKIFPHPYYA